MVLKIRLDYLITRVNNIHFGITSTALGKKNKGLRIDHFLVSQKLLDDIKNIQIDKYLRGKIKPSDHAPIKITF